MTRLKSDLVNKIGEKLASYDEELLRKTGHTLKQISCHGAAGIQEEELVNVISRVPVAVVPVTSGEGIIKGFVDAVQSIINHLGFRSFITDESDVCGLAEGIMREGEVIFLADDKSFIAINLTNRYVINNLEATSRGYISALYYLTGGLNNRNVLVIGAGRIGKSAVKILKQLGAQVAVYDIDRTKTEMLAETYNV